jgi:hypothetical protein
MELGNWLVVASSTASVSQSKDIFKSPCSESTPAELGDSWSAEDGMVGSLEVRDFELDVVGAVVFSGFPEGNWQNH